MEWLTSVRGAIEYMEAHLEDDISVQDIADSVYLSPFFMQKGFSMMTGFGIGEYLRNRRLFQAAVDLRHTQEKVIDIALRYAYETPESFSKAFTRFHGATPSQIRNGTAPIRTFLPLKITISISGGSQMNYQIKKMFPFKVIGFMKEFTNEEAYEMIPKFWDEICARYANNVYAGNAPANAYEQAIIDNCIGEYGICIDDIGADRFRYMIAGRYCGGEVPEGMAVYEVPGIEWAVFDCVGSIPDALQNVNTQIFKEWLPGNPEYELAGNINIEWYDCVNGEKTDANYRSAIWIPVRKK